jgi:hypothetical protein
MEELIVLNVSILMFLQNAPVNCVLYTFSLILLPWSQFLATDPEVPGSIPGATTFSKK